MSNDPTPEQLAAACLARWEGWKLFAKLSFGFWRFPTVKEGLFPGQKVSASWSFKILRAGVQHEDSIELCNLRRSCDHLLQREREPVHDKISAVPLLRCDEQNDFHKSSFA